VIAHSHINKHNKEPHAQQRNPHKSSRKRNRKPNKRRNYPTQIQSCQHTSTATGTACTDTCQRIPQRVVQLGRRAMRWRMRFSSLPLSHPKQAARALYLAAGLEGCVAVNSLSKAGRPDSSHARRPANRSAFIMTLRSICAVLWVLLGSRAGRAAAKDGGCGCVPAEEAPYV
jgi:hypothetical protein